MFRLLALVALPHDAQRLLTRMREQEALSQQSQKSFTDTLRALLDATDAEAAPAQADLLHLRDRLSEAIGVADEKVSLAKALHQAVQQHVRHLEDEICCFEEEVRLARTYGELDEKAAEHSEPEENEGEAELGALAPKKTRAPPSTFNSSNSGGKRKSVDVDPAGAAPRQATHPSEFDSIPPPLTQSSSAGVGGGARRSNRRSDPNAVPAMSDTAKPPMSPPAAVAGSRDAFTAQEPTYCYCDQVSFGEMIGCDNPDCDIEWFHYACVGLTAPPAGKWFCPDCTARAAKTGNMATGTNGMERGSGGNVDNHNGLTSEGNPRGRPRRGSTNQ